MLMRRAHVLNRAYDVARVFMVVMFLKLHFYSKCSCQLRASGGQNCPEFNFL